MDYYDTFVLQRQSTPFMLDIVDRLKAKGKFVIGELDDDFWHLHKDSPVYGYWYDNDFANLRVLEAFLRKCDRVTNTTKLLADILRQFNRDVVVVPNYLPARTWDVPKRTNERLVVGWAGGEPHGMDMPLLQFMGQIVKDHDIEFQVCGRQQYPFDFPYTVVAPRDIEHYPEILAGFDIGLAPIIDTQFNRSKSDLKHVEYGRMSIPAVFSKVGPYQEGVRHGVDGFLAGNPGDFLKYTKRLIEQPRLREQISKAARRKAEKRGIDRNLHRWERALNLCE